MDPLHHNCEDHLVFSGHLGAPGIGQSWCCSICDKAFHRMNASSPPIPFSEMDPEDYIMSPEDCI